VGAQYVAHQEATVVVGGKVPQTGADYSIMLAKNRIPIPTPAASMGSMLNGQGFQIVFTSDVDLVTGDYLEIGIRNNANTNSVVISDLQFRVSK
jgi:predicted naringenin-chalcone synthase